jgi:beta-galactosidase
MRPTPESFTKRFEAFRYHDHLLSRASAAFCAVLLLSSVLLAEAPSPRIGKTINRDWTFAYFPSPAPDLAPAAPGFDDSRWQAVAVPHTWSTYETTRDVHPFIRSATERDDTYWWYGWGWYRKKFTLSPDNSGKLVFLEFDGVQKYSKVYLNGKLIGEHKGGYTSFSVQLTSQVRWGEENLLAVQVSNRRDDHFGVIPPATAGNFDVYGGIYRDVRLVLKDPLHVPYQGAADHEGGTFITTPQLNAGLGTVHVRTWIKNDFPDSRMTALATIIRDASGREVLRGEITARLAPGENHEFVQDVGPLRSPHLWSPDSPYLYHVISEVRDGDRLADAYASPLGFRWYHWDFANNRMVLNDHTVLLRGMNRHQEFPWLGDAMPKWIHRQDLLDMRYNLGLNFQRTVHYPNDPFVYQMCDELGFMLIEESPNIKDIAFGRDIQKQQMQEMIRRDRNHPSIFIWSMGNETNQPADSAWAAAEDASRLIYLRRGENGGTHVQLTDHNLPIENLLRCTVRGWLNEDDHSFGSETGHPQSSQVTGTEEWQHQKNRESDRLLTGNVVTWLYADHGADRHYLNSPVLNVNPKGWVDAYRFPKLTYYLWEANYTKRPMVFIHPTYWRPQYLGQRHDIRIDSNLRDVELKLNGASLGHRTPTAANAHSVVFEKVLVSRGTLQAGAGAPTTPASGAVYTLAMAAAPTHLVLTTRQSEIAADRSGLAIVSADILDEQNVHVFGAHPPLTWTVTGPAHLVGPPRYTTDTAKKESMEGTMYIDAPVANVVRSTATAGEIRVTVSAPGLASAEVTLHSVAPQADDVPGISEPTVSDDGRAPVRRDPQFHAAVLASKVQVVAEAMDDLSFPGPADHYREQIEAYIHAHSTGVDPFSTSYRSLVERLTAIVNQRDGHLIADDYNFNARAFNDAVRPKPKAKAKNKKYQAEKPTE